jgi:CBS domain-containing membrane protein
MSSLTMQWLRAFVPQRNTVPRHERMRSVAGALVGLLLTAGLSMQLLGIPVLPLATQLPLIAPMGASAVLLFCVPASPLAQPWAVIGGNTISALIGIVCARAIGNPLLAAPLAGALAILVMFLLRCLHPPSGAVALTTVLGGPAVHAAGFGFAFVPVCLNSALIVLVALIFNNLTGRRYPHTQQSMLQNVHATRDPVPTARVGFTKEDMDAALARYGQVLDISRDDLEAILLETEAQAYGRRFGIVTCGAIMSRDAVTVRPGTPLAEAWHQLRLHGLHALPVLDKAGRVVGVVGQNDFLHHAGLDDYQTLAERLRGLFSHMLGMRGSRPGRVVEIMHRRVQTVGEHEPIAELVPLMTNRGLHHIPVVDERGIFAGVVSHSDLLAALFEGKLMETA